MSSVEKFYEHDIKKTITEKRHLFYSDGITSSDEDVSIYNEKAIGQGKCITDCLVLDRNGNVLGIEIKTERDSTKRLNNQLFYYSRVCSRVYVMCHDKHVEKVEQILKRYKHHHVGIVSYINFKGKVTVGKYKEATDSPYRHPYYCLDILWKKVLLVLLRYARDPITFKTGYNANSRGALTAGANSFSGLAVTKRNTKKQIISAMIGYLGVDNCYKIFTRSVLYGYTKRWEIVDSAFFHTLATEMGDINIAKKTNKQST